MTLKSIHSRISIGNQSLSLQPNVPKEVQRPYLDYKQMNDAIRYKHLPPPPHTFILDQSGARKVANGLTTATHGV